MNSKSSMDSGWGVVMAARVKQLRGMARVEKEKGVNNIVAVLREGGEVMGGA